MGLFSKFVISIFTLALLHGCSDENTSETEQQTKEQKLKELRLKYGSWEDFCKIRPECEDYPIGYETVLINNNPYYFPLEINSAVIPNRLSHNSPKRNFAELKKDTYAITRVVTLDKKTLEGRAKSADQRIDFSYSIGIFAVARYLGLVNEDEDYDKNFKGGSQGVFWIRKDGKRYTQDRIKNYYKDYLDEKYVEEIANYESNGPHDYDDNFWFIKYETDSFVTSFISKKPVFFGQRLYLSCLETRCVARNFNLPDDFNKYEFPSMGYTPPTFFLGEIEGSTTRCKTDDRVNCMPIEGLLYTALEHLDIIHKSFEFISTKPEDREVDRS